MPLIIYCKNRLFECSKQFINKKVWKGPIATLLYSLHLKTLIDYRIYSVKFRALKSQLIFFKFHRYQTLTLMMSIFLLFRSCLHKHEQNSRVMTFRTKIDRHYRAQSCEQMKKRCCLKFSQF